MFSRSTREPNGALIARVVGSSLDATTTRYYHFDALGSTRKLTDKDGVVTDTYTYDAWGNTTHTGSTAQPYQYVGQYGYYTHWQDDNLDLLQLGVRFYDPETGRLTQRDPIITAGESRYTYAGSDPTRLVDPSGRSYLEWLQGEALQAILAAVLANVPVVKASTCSICVGSALGIFAGEFLTCMGDHGVTLWGAETSCWKEDWVPCLRRAASTLEKCITQPSGWDSFRGVACNVTKSSCLACGAGILGKLFDFLASSPLQWFRDRFVMPF